MRKLWLFCSILPGLLLGCVQTSVPVKPYLGTPVIDFFVAEPASIQQGNSTTLQWRTEGATDLSIDQGIGKVVSAGSFTISPSSTTIYTLTAENDYDTATATIQVMVEPTVSNQPTTYPISSLPVIKVFTAQPSMILQEQSAKLMWEVQNADDVKIEPKIGLVQHNTSKTVSPLILTTYKLTASNQYGSVEAATMITVTDHPMTEYTPAIQYFTANKFVIRKGESVLLSWATINGSSVTMDRQVGIVPASGAKEVAPAQTTTYMLMVTNPKGVQYQAVTINVK